VCYLFCFFFSLSKLCIICGAIALCLKKPAPRVGCETYRIRCCSLVDLGWRWLPSPSRVFDDRVAWTLTIQLTTSRLTVLKPNSNDCVIWKKLRFTYYSYLSTDVRLFRHVWFPHSYWAGVIRIYPSVDLFYASQHASNRNHRHLHSVHKGFTRALWQIAWNGRSEGQRHRTAF